MTSPKRSAVKKAPAKKAASTKRKAAHPAKRKTAATTTPEPAAAPIEHDVFSDEKRSDIMSRIRSTRNKSTELKMIEVFRARGIRGWRRNSRLKGHPDFVFPEYRIAVFVDGCFWHGHGCRNLTPKDHAEYWRAKIERNRVRDAASTERLEKLGYLVVRVWECEFKKANAELLEEKLSKIFARIAEKTK